MFKSTKIKLTTWYLTIIMVITITFSSIVYYGVGAITTRALTSQNIRLENEFKNCVIIQQPKRFINRFDVETLDEIRHKTLVTLIWINILILTTSGILAYVLAGQTLKPIEDMVNKQKRFVSDAAHELKTPITAIKTDFEVTLRDKNSKTADLLDTIKRGLEEVQNLAILTEKLLKQSKYSFSNNLSDVQKVSLNTLIKEVYDKFKNTAGRETLTLQLPNYEVFAKVNSIEIKEAVANLIDNAIKYTPKNKNIVVELSKSYYTATIGVKDQGEGISESEIKNIFEPFYKSDKSRTDSNANGYGLGLAIVKEIVEKHSGKILVKSSVGLGSEFTITIPAL